jgi:hypothetical protein
MRLKQPPTKNEPTRFCTGNMCESRKPAARTVKSESGEEDEGGRRTTPVEGAVAAPRSFLVIVETGEERYRERKSEQQVGAGRPPVREGQKK